MSKGFNTINYIFALCRRERQLYPNHVRDIEEFAANYTKMDGQIDFHDMQIALNVAQNVADINHAILIQKMLGDDRSFDVQYTKVVLDEDGCPQKVLGKASINAIYLYSIPENLRLLINNE